MKTFVPSVALVLFALCSRAQTNFIVTNFDASLDTSWTTKVIPKLNLNYGQLIGWLNAHNSTNAAEDFAISNLNVQIGTNISYLLTLRTNTTYANGRNYTNLWGTNIVAGTLPTNTFSASTMAWLESLPNVSAQYFCRVSFGAGNGGEDNYLISNSGFGQVPFSQLENYQKTDPGGNYYETGSDFGDYYLVPVSGTYMIIATLRQTDGAGGTFGGDIGFDANVSTDGTGYDSPSLVWCPTAPGRGNFQNTHIAYFNMGDRIIMFSGSDNQPTSSDGSMTINFLHN